MFQTAFAVEISYPLHFLVSQEFDGTWYSYISPTPLHNKLGSRGKVKLNSQVSLKTY